MRGRGWVGEAKTHPTITRDLCYLLTSEDCEGLKVTSPWTQPSLSPWFSIPRARKLVPNAKPHQRPTVVGPLS